MRFDIDSQRAKDMAKTLKKALPASAGLNYQQCLDLVARQLAGTTFDALKPRLDVDAPRVEAPAGVDAGTGVPAPRMTIDDLEIDTFLVSRRLPWAFAAARAALACQPEATRVYLHYRPQERAVPTVVVDPQDTRGSIPATALAHETLRAIVHFRDCEELRGELAQLHAEHAFGDDALVLALRQQDGVLFTNDIPEHGYTDPDVGLIVADLPDGADLPQDRAETLLTDLCRTWGWWLPHAPAVDLPAYDHPIRANVYRAVGAERPPETTLDLRHAVLGWSGSLRDLIDLLQGGWTRWPFVDGPAEAGTRVYLHVRPFAEDFFRKPVEQLNATDLLRARRAHGLD